MVAPMHSLAPSLSLLPSSSSSSTRCGEFTSKPGRSIAFPLCIQAQRIWVSQRFDKNKRMTVVAAAKTVSSEKKGGVVSSLESGMEELVEDEEVGLKLPEDEPDFWEGPQWNALGFAIQYLWAFGILIALVACGIAVRTYNQGARDFRETPVFKEALRAQGKLDGAPEADSEDSADPLLLDAPPLQES
ncbi:hypothetical protein O6H91_03G121800 [Diphasiastrum complanatum]|uniref:Uncharacterized protein n=1 Tax=Diphasiastrum complanatum TaxID=34168 RepID=A0ACC2EAS3_DIPCM|nr:hypothetical protein O6H91_03G121800 [Diphasiastrum complanatum]